MKSTPIEKLTLAMDKQTPAPITATEKFHDALVAAAKSDGQKRIKYPAEILTPHVDGRIRGGTWTPLGAGTLAAILAGVELLDSKTIAQVRKLQSEYESIQDKQSAFTIRAANQTFNEQHQRLKDRAQAGDLPTAEENAFREREAIQNDFRLKHEAIGAVLAKLYRAAVDLTLPAWERAAQAVLESMQKCEDSERAAASKFEVPWVPSGIYRSHASALFQIAKRIEALKRFLNGALGYSHAQPAWTLENLTTTKI